MIKYYFAAIAASFLETLSPSFSFPVLLLVFSAFRQSDGTKLYFLATFAGVFTDFLAGRTLGVSAIFLLLSVGFSRMVKGRFGGEARVMLVMIVILELIYYLLFARLGFF